MGINPDRLLGDLAELSTIGGRADGGVDRVAWEAADLRGRQWLKGKLEAAGWHAFTDPALNVFGRASDVRRRRLLIGSHTDSVAAGGRLDGAYGVVAALEVVRVLAETADPAAEQVELVDFADEEGVRFPCGYFGAKALTGALDVQQLVGAGDVLREAGVEIADAQRASEHLQDVAGFIELHIEQGPRLEAEHASVAVVSGILGFDRYRIDIGGRAGHGGTTPFELRHDPVQAAAAFVAEVRSCGASTTRARPRSAASGAGRAWPAMKGSPIGRTACSLRSSPRSRRRLLSTIEWSPRSSEGASRQE